jgi:hypothetical protein
MSQPLALIQLVSEQTMPNLLAIIAIGPARVFHLATDFTISRATRIAEAAAIAGSEAEFEYIRLSGAPSIPETARAVNRAIAMARAQGHEPMVHFSGGTKLMSIGAFEAARAGGFTSFHLDTDHYQLIDGNTGPGLRTVAGDDLSLASLHPRITLDLIACANDCRLLSAGRDWQPYLPFANHLLAHPEEEREIHEALHGKRGIFPRGSVPTTPEDWLKVLDQPFELPEQAAAMAADLGLVRKDNVCLLPDGTREELAELTAARVSQIRLADYDRRRMAATEPMHEAIGLLTGGWWEVIVADAAFRCGRFHDLRWSVTAGIAARDGYEEDVLAVDGLQAVVVSCKRGSNVARILPHLAELDARARRIGGQSTRRFLALLHPPTPGTQSAVSQRARESGIRLLTPDDIAEPERAFAPHGFETH